MEESNVDDMDFFGDAPKVPPPRLAITRNSLGDYICPVCKKEYMQEDQAKKCLLLHNMNKSVQIKEAISAASTEKLGEYKKMLDGKDTLSAASKMVLSQVEDYLICREREMAAKGMPGVMSMQLAKQAAESIIALNKSVNGERSVSANINMEAKSSEIDAIKNVLMNRKGKE